MPVDWESWGSHKNSISEACGLDLYFFDFLFSFRVNFHGPGTCITYGAVNKALKIAIEYTRKIFCVFSYRVPLNCEYYNSETLCKGIPYSFPFHHHHQ